ncbi:hypothetical protein ACFWIP_14110, partial [Streptomyces anulatus]|uniref:hypothetical protein n=1 Tax=Streptomyces anulatus TaxID=1892 RepID=UPI003652566C
MLELNKSGTDRSGPGRLPAQGPGPDARSAGDAPRTGVAAPATGPPGPDRSPRGGEWGGGV